MADGQITMLAENTPSGRGLLAKHGLCDIPWVAYEPHVRRNAPFRQACGRTDLLSPNGVRRIDLLVREE